MLATYNESEGASIMVDAICRGAMVGISEEVNKRSKLGYVESHVLYEIFKRYMVSDMDANRVC
jgi:hypothetical protein